MKTFLIVTAVIEAGTGLGLLISPTFPVSLLLGRSLDDAAAAVIARVTGAALLALGVACWLAREDIGSRAARGLIAAMLLYDVAAAGLLAVAALGSGMSGTALWPAVAVHSGMAVWGIACLGTSGRDRS